MNERPLPLGWTTVTLDPQLVEMMSGFACARKNAVARGLAHLRPFNVNGQGGIDLTKVIYIPEDFIGNPAGYYLQVGDILFNNTNSVELVGKSAIAREPLNAAFSNHITRLRVLDRVRLDPRWLLVCLRQLWGEGFFAANCNRWIGQAGFNSSKLASVEIPLPPLETQQNIVARIDALLAEVAEVRKLQVVIQDDTNRVMRAAVNETFGSERSGLLVTAKEEEIAELGAICTLQRGKFSHRPRNEPRFFGGAYPWVQINNIPKDYSKYIVTQMDTLNDDGLAISKMFSKGTIVISIAATIGAVGILSFDACFPDSLVGIAPLPLFANDLDVGFLYWQLCYVKSHLEAIAPYAAQKNINLVILRKLKIWKPRISTQQMLNAHLDRIQAEIQAMQDIQQEDENLLRRAQQAILAQAFRGEL